MSHIGILCAPAIAHLNTILPLGQELQRRGHRLTCFGLADTEAKVAAASIPFQVIGESAFPLGSVTQVYAKIGQLQGKEATNYVQTWRQKLTELLLEEVPEILQNAGIEALLVDYGQPGGGAIADYLNIPFVTICAALIQINHGTSAHDAPILDIINRYRQQWQLPPYSKLKDCYSPIAQISQQPTIFDLPRTRRTSLPPQLHFTGSFQTLKSRQKVDFPWSKLTEQPLIYASLGTLQNRLLWIFTKIAEACADLDVQLVISLGGGSSVDALPELKGNPLVVEYAPQLELLQRASLTITHAGLNTTLESLCNGVPLIAIPITYDQPAVASRIVRKGLGLAFTLPELSVASLRSAIEEVLAQDKYRQRAAKVQEAIRDAGGIKLAGDIVEKAITTKEPVLARIVR